MGLRLVSSAKTACWPWRLRKDHGHGGQCAMCGQEIAVPDEAAGYETLCIYCAMETGIIPPVEQEPDDERSLHQVAMDGRATTPQTTP